MEVDHVLPPLRGEPRHGHHLVPGSPSGGGRAGPTKNRKATDPPKGARGPRGSRKVRKKALSVKMGSNLHSNASACTPPFYFP